MYLDLVVGISKGEQRSWTLTTWEVKAVIVALAKWPPLDWKQEGPDLHIGLGRDVGFVTREDRIQWLGKQGRDWHALPGAAQHVAMLSRLRFAYANCWSGDIIHENSGAVAKSINRIPDSGFLLSLVWPGLLCSAAIWIGCRADYS